MKTIDIAKVLDGLIYPLDNWTKEYIKRARDNNIIILYGKTNDVGIINGFIEEEIGIYNGIDFTLDHYNFDNRKIKNLLKNELKLKVLNNGIIKVENEIIFQKEEHKDIRYSFLLGNENFEYSNFRLMDGDEIESLGLIVKI